AKYGIRTALQYARQDEPWVRSHLTKPFYEIWQELNGRSVLPLDTQAKATYQSIQKMKTFTPPSDDRRFVFAQLAKNIENAAMKARRYQLAPRSVVIFLRTQDYRDVGLEVGLSRPTAFPNEIIGAVEPAFDALFRS